MKKVFKKLTEEQKRNGVMFSSALSKFRTERQEDRIHKVYKDDKNKDVVIDRLLDDKSFNHSPWKYNIIRW